MRCHYLSDLHLETQDFARRLPGGDVLIIAGDLCHARCLDPARTDKYSIDQRARVMRFIDEARRNFAHVLMIPGNHEHYDGVFEDTVRLLRRHLPGVTVLDDETTEIDGVRFFGSTLWSDFDGGSEACMNGVRRRMGEFFFVKTRSRDSEGNETFAKFRPENAFAAHEKAWSALIGAVTEQAGEPTIVITHHAPSLQGLNPKFKGNGLHGAYASALDDKIAALSGVPVWVHGHTHIARTYRIGATSVRSNALGFESKGHGAQGFATAACFEV
ncbi:MAG: hypothetical protein F9K29_03750 [Hyphomicrobiaceae bacterium]|nr:MAG: hypothetical protein F9K29_03750 [Hyphomicrobiaceae bacterium]